MICPQWAYHGSAGSPWIEGYCIVASVLLLASASCCRGWTAAIRDDGAKVPVLSYARSSKLGKLYTTGRDLRASIRGAASSPGLGTSPNRQLQSVDRCNWSGQHQYDVQELPKLVVNQTGILMRNNRVTTTRGAICVVAPWM